MKLKVGDADNGCGQEGGMRTGDADRRGGMRTGGGWDADRGARHFSNMPKASNLGPNGMGPTMDAPKNRALALIGIKFDQLRHYIV